MTYNNLYHLFWTKIALSQVGKNQLRYAPLRVFTKHSTYGVMYSISNWIMGLDRRQEVCWDQFST